MAETQTSDVVVPNGTPPGPNPHHKGPNGTGGKPGTHEGHANSVPTSAPVGGGYGTRGQETKGNAAAQQGVREAQDSGSAYPPASGTRPPPVAQ